jgi:polyhydroxyalkanoate synthesis regulator phasin
MGNMEVFNIKINSSSEQGSQPKADHAHSHAQAAAVHNHLAAAAGSLGANPPASPKVGDPNDGVNWPWDPSENYTPYSSGTNETPQQMLNDWVHYLANLQDGSASLYNDSLEHLQQLIALGQEYSQLTPDQQKLYQNILQQVTSSDGTSSSIISQLMKGAMMGAMTQNGASPQGIAQTQAFLNYLTGVTATFAGVPVQLISNLAYQAQNEASIVQSIMSSDVVNYTVGSKTYQVFMINGVVMDFDSFKQTFEGSFGQFIQGSNIAGVIQNFYGFSAEMIMDQFRGPDGKLTDPWLVLILLMGLLNGQDIDMGIAVKGYGNQLTAIKNDLSKINDLLGKIKSGSLTAAQAKDFMSELVKLQADVSNNPLTANLAPYLNESINDIMSQPVSLPTSGTPPVEGPYSYTTLSDGLIVFPSNLPAGTTIKIGATTYTNVNPPPAGQTYFFSGETLPVAAGTSVVITPPFQSGSTTQYVPLTLQQLGAITTLNFGSGSSLDYGTLGDFTDVAAALNSLGLGGMTTDFTGMETTLNGQSATVQQQIQTMTNTESKFEGMQDDFYSSFKDIETTINHGLQSANQ